LERTATEIDTLRTEKEKEVLKAEGNRDTTELEIILLRREADELRIKIKDLETVLIKAKCLVRERKAEKAELDREFWRARNSGL
jgi:hypothetical protein